MKVLLLALLVGCAGDGVIVEVDTAGLAVDSVELVLADRVCQDPLSGEDCGAIQGQGFTSFLGEPGDIYARDGSATVHALEDGVARFELPAENHRVRMAFAIGRDAQHQIVGVAVMARTLDLATGPVVYRVALDPTGDLRNDRQPGRAAAAQWGDRCLGIHPLRSTMKVQRPIFIVPDDDPDCDGRRTTGDGECNPLWFDGVLLDEATASHCVQPSMVIDGAPCIIGHVPQCVEGDVAEPLCVESPLQCVPDVVCKACASDDTECQNQQLASTTIETRVDCVIPASIDVDNDLGTSCVGDSFFIDAASLPMLDRNVTCTSAEFVKTPEMAIGSEVETKTDLDGAKIDIKLVTPDCEIKFAWEGTITEATINSLHTVLVVHLDVGGQSRELWMPINFTAGNACIPPNGVSTCTFTRDPDGDAIGACLR